MPTLTLLPVSCARKAPRHEDIGAVLDHAARVPPRFRQIDDAEIGGVRGIELALGRADDALMGAGIADAHAVGKRLDLVDDDGGDFGLGGARVGAMANPDETQSPADAQPQFSRNTLSVTRASCCMCKAALDAS